MSGEPSIEMLSDLGEIVANIEMATITVFGLSVQRATDDEGNIPEVSLEDFRAPTPGQIRAMFQEDEDTVSVRLLGEQPTPGALVEFDLAVTYGKARPFGIDDSVRPQFIQNYAVMTLYPYVRQHVHDLTSRIGLPAVLPLIRIGSGSVTAVPDDQEESE